MNNFVQSHLQQDLFDQRKENSFAAHEEIKPKKGGHKEMILETMKYLGVKLTSYQIADSCSLNEAQIHKRLPELVKENKIELCGTEDGTNRSYYKIKNS